MKQFVTLLFVALCSTLAANAQNYLDHLQQKTEGPGTVTVTQSKEIDDLVNGSNQVQQPTTTNTGKPATAEQRTNATNVDTSKNLARQNEKSESEKKDEEEKKEEHKAELPVAKKTETTGEETAPIVDTSKKVMRNSRKVKGYRVQVFAGGNSRADREKAEQAGNAVKRKYPTEPVYVHFYSPRWVCRVGNYRTLEEANRMMRNVRNMGFKEACVITGQITVQY
ncbi:MAG: SPOR domain-containing protein [Prevotella sp.]|nr:SPOR domain-containing protein [Prevotella sp.]